DFEIAEVALEQITPQPGSGPLQLGYIDSHSQRPYRLTLKEQAIADAALPGHSLAYRELDTGVLEALVLKGALGLSDEDISHFNGLFYARDADEALAMVRSGSYDAAFLLRATPVQQVRDVAAAGENMPPKSTYFFPKLLTGLLFNPLSKLRAGHGRPFPLYARYTIEIGRHTERRRMSGPEKPARMKATAVRDGGSFKHTIQVRDHTLTVDEPVSSGGADSGPDPQELLAVSLASCTAI